jgi:hypothetical protein
MGAPVTVRHQLQLKSLENFSPVTDGDGFSIEEAVFKSAASIERPSPTVTTVTTRTIGDFWRWWKSSPDHRPWRRLLTANLPRHMIKPRWKKGERGNRAREMSVEGLEQLCAFARDRHRNVAATIMAWKVIMERAFGKAVQPIALGLETLEGDRWLR